MSTLKLLQDIGLCDDVAGLVIDHKYWRNEKVIRRIHYIIVSAGHIFDTIMEHAENESCLMCGCMLHVRKNNLVCDDMKMMVKIKLNQITRLNCNYIHNWS